MNRYYLGLLANMDESSPLFNEFSASVKRLEKLSIQDFTKVVRILVRNYLKGGQGLVSILKSKKIGD